MLGSGRAGTASVFSGSSWLTQLLAYHGTSDGSIAVVAADACFQACALPCTSFSKFLSFACGIGGPAQHGCQRLGVGVQVCSKIGRKGSGPKPPRTPARAGLPPSTSAPGLRYHAPLSPRRCDRLGCSSRQRFRAWRVHSARPRLRLRPQPRLAGHVLQLQFVAGHLEPVNMSQLQFIAGRL